MIEAVLIVVAVAALGCAGAYYGNTIVRRNEVPAPPLNRSLPLIAIGIGPNIPTETLPAGKRICGECKWLTFQDRRHKLSTKNEGCGSPNVKPLRMDPVSGEPLEYREVYLQNLDLACKHWEAKT